MNEKKKRGLNYTPAEKEIILQLVRKYQNIIENKETNTNMILKKREAWNSVCQQYNSLAMSGFRTWKQLRHLYENLKQRSKKNITEMNRLQFYEKSKYINKKAILHKKEINHTGGSYKNTLTEQDSKILAIVAAQEEHLSDTHDNTALYFDDRESATTIICPHCDKPISTINLNVQDKNEKNEKNIQQEYFKQKLRNAKLESKYIMNKNKMEINKHKLEMEILHLRLKKLKSPRLNY